MLQSSTSHVSLILHDIRSAHNVGSIFRTADGAGVAQIYLTGYTPRPTDRFGRLQPEIVKTALGAEQTVPYEAADDVADIIRRLREEGTMVVAVEQSPGSVAFTEFTPPERVAYIFGNEVTGLPAEVLGTADETLELPMRGAKESLNVAVTAGIVCYHEARDDVSRVR